MTYKLEIRYALPNSINSKKATKKFDNKHELAEFLVNLCDDVFINSNSGEEKNSKYTISDGDYGGPMDCSDMSKKFTIRGDNRLIDYCMYKYGDLLVLNGKTDNYFNSSEVPTWRGGNEELEEEDYKNACRYLTQQRKLQRAR